MISKYFDTKYYKKIHIFEPSEEGYKDEEQLTSGNEAKKAALVQEGNEWALRFYYQKVSDEWIQQQVNGKKGARNVAGYVAAGATAVALSALDIGGNSHLQGKKVKAVYDKVSGTFDETAFREKCKSYDNHGTLEVLYPKNNSCYWDIRKGTWRQPEEVILGGKSTNSRANVDESRCVTFFYKLVKGWGYSDLESTTIEFQSRAEAERIYSFIKQFG